LKSHMLCHSGARPHNCPDCEASFARKHDLQRHVRTLHTDQRRFKCGQCGQAFARADALRRH
ncbi:hypothetical protein CXG81DRAFT_4847, partial [Caulochytrium protostelioides]